MKIVKITFKFYEKYFHNPDFSTEKAHCQYIF